MQVDSAEHCRLQAPTPLLLSAVHSESAATLPSIASLQLVPAPLEEARHVPERAKFAVSAEEGAALEDVDLVEVVLDGKDDGDDVGVAVTRDGVLD